MDAVHPEKTKKKRKRETLEQQDFVETTKQQKESEKQNGKHKKHKKKKEKEMEILSVQTPTEKKKKRKLNEIMLNVEEVSLMDDAPAPEVENSPMTPSYVLEKKKKKKKKKRRKEAKSTHSDCDDMAVETHEEQSGVTSTEQENVPCGNDQQTVPNLTHSDIHIGIGKRKRKTADGTTDVDPQLLNEMKEFVPDLEMKSSEHISKMIVYDLPRFREFKMQGIALKHGRFSAEENIRLRKNVQDFLALTGLQSATKLFHTRRFPDDKNLLIKLKKDYKFFGRIAEGIPRSCYEVFVRGRRTFDGENYKGRFTKEEVKALLKFQTLHGNNWQKISELTGRSAYALEKRFSQMNKKFGPWSEKELQRLLKAVRDYIVTALKTESRSKRTPTRVSREMLYKKLPWFEIARKVKTRCWTKCRDKWMAILAVRMSSGTVCNGRKTQEAKIRLIKAMYESQVEDAADVNWEELTTVFGDVPPAHVQLKWHQLKVCYVPNWQNKCFGDIVDFLYEKILPTLEKDCVELDENDQRVDQQESFRLSDIFHSIKDNCDDDDNNDDDDDDDDEESGQ